MDTLLDIAPTLAALAGLILASAFFSGTEVAMFSLRRSERRALKKATEGRPRLISKMLSKPRQLITTILIGNEIVNVTTSAVIAGLAPRLYSGATPITMALISTFTALPILLCFGEIAPKVIAIQSPRRWTHLAIRPLFLWSLFAWPIRVVVRIVVFLMLAPFGQTRKKADKSLSEEEFRTLVDEGSREGQLDAREQKLIHRVFEFDDKTVGQVMQPRSKLFALSYDLARPQLIEEVASRGYSRVPIYQRSLDNVRGILYAKDLVAQAVGVQQPMPLAELLHRPLFVPKAIPCGRLFRMFKQQRTHMALVVNEYGKLVGVITMEDLLEELFGEIRDEREQQKEGRHQRESSQAVSGGGQ